MKRNNQFTIYLTDEELELVNSERGALSINGYIRSKLFGIRMAKKTAREMESIKNVVQHDVSDEFRRDIANY